MIKKIAQLCHILFSEIHKQWIIIDKNYEENAYCFIVVFSLFIVAILILC